MIPYPNINPIAFSIGPFNIFGKTIGPFSARWYGIAYALGFLIGYFYIKHRIKISNYFKNKTIADDLIFYSIIGVIVGGRLGYVLIYNLAYYISHPLRIFYVWQGGMSFHGALIGLVIVGLYITKKYNVRFYKLADEVAVIAPVGIFFGRIANFINDELWGRPSNLPWAIAFPRGGYIPRQPSQLYEALFEGLILFLILFFSRDKLIKKEGFLFWLFILLYGIFRFFVEFTREPDPQIGFILGLTMGQWLCLAMIVTSTIFFIILRKNWKNAP
jgi:phosphatidylglycerol:prolipoprotein diacylglycerol transferase